MSEGNTHYLIVRDENGGSVVTEEHQAFQYGKLMNDARGMRLIFPIVELHTVGNNGRGSDTYRLMKTNGELSRLVNETRDENN